MPAKKNHEQIRQFFLKISNFAIRMAVFAYTVFIIY